MSLSPQVCKKNYKVHIPAMGEECEFWLVRVTDEGSITNPDKDHAYYTDDGKLFIYDGKNLVRVNCDLCFTQDERDKLEGIEEGANKYVLPVANDSSLGGIKTGFTQTEKQYAVEVTEEGQAYVTVPWTDTVYTLPVADTDTLGGVKLGYSQNGKNYPVLKDSEGNIYVAVPWVEYQLQQASAETLGGIKTGYEQQGQNYPVDTDIEGNAYVTVPWSDTGYQPATDQQLGLLMLGHQYTLGDFPLVFDSESRAYTQLPFSNPNLLDNADFKSGIINQRGNTTYGLVLNWTGSIDRWIYVSYGPITVGEGYIQVGPSASNKTTYFKQRLYKTINEELTCAVQVKSLTGTCKMNFSKTFVDKEIHEGLNIINIPANQNVDTVQFNLEGANSQIQIEFVKLEKGSVFTGMPQWDFVLEWFKCQRYLYIVVNSSILNARYDGSNLCINFKTPMSFVNRPSIIHNNATFGVTFFDGSYESHNVSDFTVNTYDGGNINIIKPSSNPTRYGVAIVINGFYLDVETY